MEKACLKDQNGIGHSDIQQALTSKLGLSVFSSASLLLGALSLHTLAKPCMAQPTCSFVLLWFCAQLCWSISALCFQRPCRSFPFTHRPFGYGQASTENVGNTCVFCNWLAGLVYPWSCWAVSSLNLLTMSDSHWDTLRDSSLLLGWGVPIVSF